MIGKPSALAVLPAIAAQRKTARSIEGAALAIATLHSCLATRPQSRPKTWLAEPARISLKQTQGGTSMARFDGKVILISGGARGQGAAESRLLIAQGAKVVIGDVLEKEGSELAKQLGAAAKFVRHDVTQEADWARAIQTAETLGGLHGLVNNAAIYQPKRLLETDNELWERHIRINQTGCFLGMKAVVPAMERAGGGSVVDISS